MARARRPQYRAAVDPWRQSGGGNSLFNIQPRLVHVTTVSLPALITCALPETGAARGGGHASVVDIQRARHRDSSSRGRTMPSFAILQYKVVRFRPKRAAAPWGPATTQLVACNASRICARIASSSVADCDTTGAALRVPGLLAGTCGHRTPWADRITARSMTCCNSRTLPGQS